MGFWDVTKRLVQGKPGFEPPKQDDSWDNDAPTTDYAEDREAKRQQYTETSLYDQGGNKTIPVVGVTRVKYDISGPNIEVWAAIQNHSTRSVWLDKMTLLGQASQFGYRLEPGLQCEFRVFLGKRPTNDHYHKAQLYYKDHHTGDYFRADHLIEYHFDPHDHTYSIEELTPVTPINDV